MRNNYVEGCLWEGVFTEYTAVQNYIVGNTVVANVTYDQGIHINGALNVVVDNTVLLLDGVTPGGIACTSQLAMYDSYALSNRIVGNTCGRLALGGDGGSDNYAAENTANVTLAGAASPLVTNWFKPVNASSRIAGVGTAAAAVVSDAGYAGTRTNTALTRTVEIVANQVQPGGRAVATVAQLQALLDAHPNTVFNVTRSQCNTQSNKKRVRVFSLACLRWPQHPHGDALHRGARAETRPGSNWPPLM